MIEVVDPTDRISNAYLHERLGRYLWMAADGQGSHHGVREGGRTPPRGRGADPVAGRRPPAGTPRSRCSPGATRCRLATPREAIDVAGKALGARSIEGHARNNLGVCLARFGHRDDGVVELKLARQIAEDEQDDSDDSPGPS